MPSINVFVRDFTGPVTQLRVKKLPGMETVQLLDKMPSGSGSGGSADSEESKVCSLAGLSLLSSLAGCDSHREMHVHVCLCFRRASGPPCQTCLAARRPRPQTTLCTCSLWLLATCTSAF